MKAINWDEIGVSETDETPRPYVWFGDEQDSHVIEFRDPDNRFADWVAERIVGKMPKPFVSEIVALAPAIVAPALEAVYGPAALMSLRQEAADNYRKYVNCYRVGNGRSAQSMWVGVAYPGKTVVVDHGQNSYYTPGSDNFKGRQAPSYSNHGSWNDSDTIWITDTDSE